MEFPTLKAIEDNRARLGDLVLETPSHHWQGAEIEGAVAPGTDVILKLELFQYTGTFKPRGALTNIMNLDKDALSQGITAVSAGNHAIAAAYAAKTLGVSAKVVMLSTASKIRVEKCQSYGAEVVLVDDVHKAFDLVHEIEASEGRAFIHPFEGKFTALGTATAGLEFGRQVPNLDAMIIPIGGGGLCAGFSAALKQLQPDVEIIGVEPHGARSMTLSFAAGSPQAIQKVETIADSLGAPHAAPYSFALCQKYLDDIVLISDEEMVEAMKLLFYGMKLAVEPAGAAATAALTGPLKNRLAGKRVGVLICGSNISTEDFTKFIG